MIMVKVGMLVEGVMPKNTRVYSLAMYDRVLFAGTQCAASFRSTDNGILGHK